MRQFGWFSRKAEKNAQVSAESKTWRAYEDQPLSLTAPKMGETVTGQRAIVMAFAAVAVAGGAYFATMAFMEEGGETLFAATEAEAATPPASSSDANAAAAQAEPKQAQAASEGSPAAPPSVEAPKTVAAMPARPAAQMANAIFPAPIKVKTTVVPMSNAPKPVDPASTEGPDQKWARLASTSDSGPANPLLQSEKQPAAANAYAAGSDPMMLAGVQAVIEEATGKQEVSASASDEEEVTDRVAASGRATNIRSSVKLRSRPVSGSRVIAVIPRNASVNVSPGCEHWCRVTFKGQSGYVYKSFLR